jgi:uncharacterized NAD-dependent epimerase/dehydratase family protein
MRKTRSETLYRRPRIAPARAEYGDIADVRATFGLKESLCYHLFRNGKIKGVLIPGTSKTGGRGKRLFCFESIRKFIASHEGE